MIYVLKNGKFKVTNYDSAEKLREIYGVDEVINAKELDKELSKGNHVYCWISPYDSEIDNIIYMHWGKNPDEELKHYHQSAEEI